MDVTHARPRARVTPTLSGVGALPTTHAIDATRTSDTCLCRFGANFPVGIARPTEPDRRSSTGGGATG
jgi:hypothetical protein